MALALACSASSQCDVMEERNIVTNYCSLANNNASRVVYEDAFANFSSRVDVYLHHLGYPALDGNGQGLQPANEGIKCTLAILEF